MNLSIWQRTLILALGLFFTMAGQATDLRRVSNPDEAGLRSGPLAALLDHIRREQLDIRALVVARRGQIGFEWHSALSSPEHNHKIFSVTKSVVALLLGQALAQQETFSVDSAVGDLFKHLSPTPDVAAITLEQLLMMRSGLAEARAPSPAFVALHRAPDRVRHIVGQDPLRAPGVRFQYGNAGSQLLAGAVQTITGVPLVVFAEKHLFRPLGFSNYNWMYPDRQGLVTGGYGLRLRAEDMARLGQLALQRGQWAGVQHVPEAYMARATRAGPDRFYGYQWWTGVAAAGQDSFAALGVRGQLIQVVPSKELVFVMTASLKKSDARRVRVDVMQKFVMPAVDGTPDSPADRQALAQARQRMQSYKPDVTRPDDLPLPPGAQ